MSQTIGTPAHVARFKKALASGTSKRALNRPTDAVEPTNHGTNAFVTPRAGKRGTPMRSIVAYERKGPFFRQVAEKFVSGEAWPVMQRYFVHRFKHATKGWREYTGGPVMTMPQAMPAINPARAFYGSHFGIPR